MTYDLRFLNKEKLIRLCLKYRKQGLGNKAIGKILGIHRNTVLKYLKVGGATFTS